MNQISLAIHRQDGDKLNALMSMKYPQDVSPNVEITRTTKTEHFELQSTERPLHLCVKVGWYDGVEILLQAGASVNKTDESICTFSGNVNKHSRVSIRPFQFVTLFLSRPSHLLT